MNRGRNELAAAAQIVSEEAKLAAYRVNVARLPKRDRRDLAAAGPQTRWIIDAVSEWFHFGYHAGRGPAGIPTENVLHRAALLLPRPPLMGSAPIKDPPPLVLAVDKAIGELQDSRVRVLIACERAAGKGIEAAARDLGMSVDSTKRYLKQARDGLAHVLRGMGWKVPKEE